MTITRSVAAAALALAAAGGLAATAACTKGSTGTATGSSSGGGPGPGGGAVQAGQGEMLAGVEVKAARAGADAKLTVTNKLAHPIALVGWSAIEEGAVARGADPLARGTKLRGKSGGAYGGAFVWEAMHQVDDPGPQARAPMPDRLVVTEGDLTAVLLPMVAPGATWSTTVPLQGYAHVAVRYAELAGQLDVFHVQMADRDELPLPDPGQPRSWGFTDVARYTLRGYPVGAIDPAMATPAWPAADSGLAITPRPGLPELHAYGLFEEVLARATATLVTVKAE